jgi:hypothetical protein
MYEMICEAKFLYGVEILGVKKGWEIIEGKFCKRVIRFPRNSKMVT